MGVSWFVFMVRLTQYWLISHFRPMSCVFVVPDKTMWFLNIPQELNQTCSEVRHIDRELY